MPAAVLWLPYERLFLGPCHASSVRPTGNARVPEDRRIGARAGFAEDDVAACCCRAGDSFSPSAQVVVQRFQYGRLTLGRGHRTPVPSDSLTARVDVGRRREGEWAIRDFDLLRIFQRATSLDSVRALVCESGSASVTRLEELESRDRLVRRRLLRLGLLWIRPLWVRLEQRLIGRRHVRRRRHG